MLSSIALTLTLAMQEQVDVGAAAAFSSYVAGQRWDFVVSHEDIGNSPRWLDTDDSDWLVTRQSTHPICNRSGSARRRRTC